MGIKLGGDKQEVVRFFVTQSEMAQVHVSVFSDTLQPTSWIPSCSLHTYMQDEVLGSSYAAALYCSSIKAQKVEGTHRLHAPCLFVHRQP